MSIWTEPSPSDFERWEQRLANGEEPSAAAKAEGHTCSAFKRADPARHKAALEMGREARDDDDRVLARTTLRQVCADGEAPHAAKVSAANTLVKTSGWLTERVEITGADGGPVEFEDRSATLADVAAVLVATGALQPDGSVPAHPQVPDARPLLAEPAAG